MHIKYRAKSFALVKKIYVNAILKYKPTRVFTVATHIMFNKLEANTDRVTT